MKDLNLKGILSVSERSDNAPAFGTLKKTMVLFVSAALIFASCKKSSDDAPEASGDAVTAMEAGDNDAKISSSKTSAPTGNPIVTYYPVRAAHNHGYDAATNCAPSSWNCNRQYSNEDFIAGDHYGNDIWAALNAPIAAPCTGVITFKGFDSGLGNTVVIRDANGWHHWLGHLNSIKSGIPGVGSSVSAGTVVGYLGHTGSNSGGVNHLHYSINYGSGQWSTGIDPWPYTYPVELDVCNTNPPAPCGSIGIFETFASGVGRFTRQPTYSGSTVGVATTSTASHYVSGSSTHLKVTLNDNTSVTTNWFVRLLSGDGIAANNVCTQKTGKLFFYLKTANAGTGAQVKIWVDDSDGTEQSTAINVINDNAWHKYEWPLSTTTWTAAAGGNGALTASTVTLDAIILTRPNNSAQWVSYIDDVGN